MSLLNLSLGELLAVFGAISGILVTLYLLDRSRRHQVVATFRFWRPAETASNLRQRRRIQQPWSLILQIVSMLLLLLAIAQMQWGTAGRNRREHVLILDTSAWMDARNGNRTLMDEARLAALAYVRAVPASDRILLVRADGLVTPVSTLDSSREAIERAIRASKPSSSALDLDQAVEFARRAQQSGKPGEIVYVGPGRVAGTEGVTTVAPENMRVIPVSTPLENCGIRRMGLRRSSIAPDQWEVFLTTRNYGSHQQFAQLALQFGGAPLGSRALTLKPGEEQESVFPLRTKAAGWVEARLLHNDAFPADNRAVLEVPAQGALRVVVYTDSPELLRPVLAASSRLEASFRAPSAYDPAPAADVIILDRFAPPSPPRLPSIWIEPPSQHSPIPIRASVRGAKLTRWNSDDDLGAGLRTHDLVLESTEVFEAALTDVRVAEVDRGPVVLARPQQGSQPKLAVLGFHPVRTAMKFELATPLLFANLMRWVRPDLFRRWELNGGTVGSVSVELDKHVNPASVRVISDAGKPVPYTIDDTHLRFFTATPGTVRVQAGEREIVYSLTLPDVGASEWTVPAKVKRGVPRFSVRDTPVTDLWPWLALAGTLGLLIEWFLYGRGRRAGRMVAVPARAGQRVLQKRAS